MAVQTPPMPPSTDPGIEGGVIEDARLRQRRHRMLGAALVSAAIAAGLIVGLHGGGGGGSGGGNNGGSPGAGGGAPAPSSHPATSRFPNAPQSDPGRFAHYRYVCPREARGRYLPPRSGCTTVLHADVDGDGRRDLVILYAKLGKQVRGGYLPASWTLEVATTPRELKRVHIAPANTHPFIMRIGNINAVAGAEILIQPSEVSSGSPETFYTFHSGTLHRVPTAFNAGGDSIVRERLLCKPGSTPRVLQEDAETQSSSYPGKWHWTVTTYMWHGATLVRQGQRRFVRSAVPTLGKRAFGGGCGRIVGPTGDQ